MGKQFQPAFREVEKQMAVTRPQDFLPRPARWLHWRRWLRRDHRGQTWTWNSWRVFLVPTPFGWAYGSMLVALFLFAANYQLSLAYALLFLALATGLAGAVETVRHLQGLQLTARAPELVVAGEPLRWPIAFHAPEGAEGSAVTVSAVADEGQVIATVLSFSAATGEATLPLPTTQRGAYPAPCFAVSTTLPWGLVRAWAVWQPPVTAWVAPKPLVTAPPFPRAPERCDAASGEETSRDGVDWGDWRTAHPGERLRRVHMRQLARRGDVWLAETVADGAPVTETVVLRYDDAVGETVEERLACLAAWVFAADAAGLSYGLELPDSVLPTGLGEAHRTAALLRLALFGFVR